MIDRIQGSCYRDGVAGLAISATCSSPKRCACATMVSHPRCGWATAR